MRACAGSTKYSLPHTKVSCRPPAAIAFSTRWTAYCLTSRLKTTNSGVSGIRPAFGAAYGRLFGTGCRKLFRCQSHFLSFWPILTKLYVQLEVRYVSVGLFFFLPMRRKNRVGHHVCCTLRHVILCAGKRMQN